MFVYLFIYLCMYIYNVYDDKTWVLKSPPLQMEHVFTANLHHWGMWILESHASKIRAGGVPNPAAQCQTWTRFLAYALETAGPGPSSCVFDRWISEFPKKTCLGYVHTLRLVFVWKQ